MASLPWHLLTETTMVPGQEQKRTHIRQTHHINGMNNDKWNSRRKEMGGKPNVASFNNNNIVCWHTSKAHNIKLARNSLESYVLQHLRRFLMAILWNWLEPAKIEVLFKITPEMYLFSAFRAHYQNSSSQIAWFIPRFKIV